MISTPLVITGVFVVTVFCWHATAVTKAWVWLVTVASGSFAAMFLSHDRLLIRKYMEALYSCDQCASLNSGDTDSFVTQLNQLRQQKANGLTASFIRGVWTIGLLAGVLVIAFSQLTFLKSELRRLECGAVCCTGVLALITHLRVEPLTKQLKFMEVLLLLLVVGVVVVAIFLLHDPQMILDGFQLDTDPQSPHVFVLVIVGCLQFFYDLAAAIGSNKAEPHHRREHFLTCALVDFPVIVSSLVVFGYWWWRKAEMTAEMSEGLLGGVILTQLVVSALLFVTVKEFLVRQRSHQSAPMTSP